MDLTFNLKDVRINKHSYALQYVGTASAPKSTPVIDSLVQIYFAKDLTEWKLANKDFNAFVKEVTDVIKPKVANLTEVELYSMFH